MPTLKYARSRACAVLATVDCREIQAIKHELAVYVADQLGAIPAIKLNEFVITTLDDDDAIDSRTVVDSVREYLESIGESRNFAILPDGDRVIVHSISGKTIERRAGSAPEMFSCPHCGFVTSYEVEYNAHKRIHYL